MDLFSNKDKSDLDFVRERRLAFINGLLNENGMPVPENNDAFLRALKDTEASVMGKAKLQNGQQEVENSAQQNALLGKILGAISGPSDDPNDIINIEAIEIPMLPAEHESDSVVPGEDLDSSKGQRDLGPSSEET